MELELGVGLLRLADPHRGGDILERIQRVRQVLASEMGVILPKVRVRDNLRLEPNEYRIKIADSTVAHGSIDAAAADPGRLIAAELSETVFGHADELLTRDAVKHLIDQLPAALAGGGRRADSRRDEAGRSAAGPATAAARGHLDPPVGADPGDARRLRAADAERESP